MENKKRLIDVTGWDSFYSDMGDSRNTMDTYDRGYMDALDNVDDWMDAQPTIDAVEVVHGRWILSSLSDPWNNWHECSECRTVGSPQWKRCPVCEAKMDGERKDNG